MAASDLPDLAEEWLETLADAVASTTGGAIDNRYVAVSPPPLDCCELLTVHTVGSVEAPTSPLGPIVEGQRPTLFAMHFVGLVATVVREISVVDDTGAIPTTAEMNADGRKVMEDLWAIVNWTRQRHRSNLLFSSPSGKRELFLDAQVSLPAQGGLAGWAVPIRVELGGYSLSS